MMSTMTKTSIWQQVSEDRLLKSQKRALRRNQPLKVYSSKDLTFHLQHGWKILSHNPASYGRPQFWLLLPATLFP